MTSLPFGDRRVSFYPLTVRPTAIAVHLALASLFVVTASLGLAAPAHAQSLKSYRIPAGPLGPALTRFASEAGVVLSFAPASVAGKSTQGLNGSYAAEDGFKALLDGSGYRVGKSAAGYTLVAVAQRDAAGETTLPTVNVNDAAFGTASEGTGQYVARVVAIGKSVQSPSEIPQSISVITRQQLDDRNITKLEDAVRQTTGMTVTRFDGAGNFNSIQSRGFDVGAIQLDGVPIAQGTNYATALDTAIYDRIEVLRGPSGLLQGTGEPGGAINLVRKRALAQAAVGGNVSAGSFDSRRADVDLTGPLNAAGTLRGRLVAVDDRRDSYVDTLFNNKQLGYGTLELDLAPATTLSAGFTRQDVHAAIDQGLPSFANGQLLDVPRSTLAGLSANRQDLQTDDAFVELEHRLDNGGQIKFSARDVVRSSFYRAARASSAVAATGAVTLQTVDFQQENSDRNYDLFFASPITVGQSVHRLLLGVSRNEGEALGGNVAYGPNIAFNIYNPNYDLAYPTLVLPGYQSVTTRREDALYGQAQISATQRLKLLLGGRLSWAEVDTRRLSDNALTASADPGRQFTPALAAIYDFGAGVSSYVSYSETFVVQTALTAAGDLLPPRTGSQAELGVKGEFLDKRVQSHAALFRINDKNRAITDPAVATASIAGGEVRSQGFETEISGQLARGWDIVAGYAYTDTTYLKAPVAQQGQVFSTFTPKHSVNLFTRYALRSPQFTGWSVGGGVAYRSEFYAQSGSVQLVTGDYAIFNAQVGYQVSDKVSLSLNAENLFDKTYYDKVSGTTRQNFYGEPRRLMLTLSARY